MRRDSWLSLLAFLAVSCTAGCTDDDDGDTGKDDAGAEDAGKQDAGKPASPRRDAGVAAPATVKCGSATCEAPMGIFPVDACCADAAKNLCGISAMGAPCAAPAVSDPRCPALDVMGFMVASCCTADGQCGIDATQFGMPCISLAQAAMGAMSRGGAGGAFAFPKPQACGGASDGGTGDGGTGDGGTGDGGGDGGTSDGGLDAAVDGGATEGGTDAAADAGQDGGHSDGG